MVAAWLWPDRQYRLGARRRRPRKHRRLRVEQAWSGRHDPGARRGTRADGHHLQHDGARLFRHRDQHHHPGPPRLREGRFEPHSAAALGRSRGGRWRRRLHGIEGIQLHERTYPDGGRRPDGDVRAAGRRDWRITSDDGSGSRARHRCWTRGIGLATTKRLLEDGFHVVMVDRNAEPLAGQRRGNCGRSAMRSSTMRCRSPTGARSRASSPRCPASTCS